MYQSLAIKCSVPTVVFAGTESRQHVLPDTVLSTESELPIQLASVVCVDESGTQGDEVLARCHVGRYAFDGQVHLLQGSKCGVFDLHPA